MTVWEKSRSAGEKPLRIAAYCRVSTEKEEQLLSLQAQKEFFFEFARRQGVELVALYADEGISGTKLKTRKEFNRMMDDARQGKFDCIYVKDVSRLARNVVDFLQSIRTLKALNIDCRFVTANMSSNEGELTLTILAAVAQEESANLSRRVKFGKKRNARQGRVPNFVFGYDKTIGDYFNLRINTGEAMTVRRIFDCYTSGRQGVTAIARLLNEEGLRTKRGCRWSPQAVTAILTNRLYRGQVVNGKESVINFLTGKRQKNNLEQLYITEKPELIIVEVQQFKAAQKILERRRKKGQQTGRKQNSQHCFSTLIRCAVCGAGFRRICRRYAREYVRWCCSRRNLQGIAQCCNKTQVEEKELLAAVCSYLEQAAKTESKKKPGKIPRLPEAQAAKNGKAAVIQAELAGLDRLLYKLRQLFEADLITLEELAARAGAIKEQMAQGRQQLYESQGSCAAEQISTQLETIRTFFPAAVQNNALLRQLIEEIRVAADGEVRVYLRDYSR